ncbi:MULTISPECIES: alpha/beta hydrolase [unclassified Cupriavidus]|uniref:alpha/beta hydrolase n=1 Tax=Cupriavidus sp. H19C3 TaxID=3241603 RepID=UPI003BF87A47
MPTTPSSDLPTRARVPKTWLAGAFAVAAAAAIGRHLLYKAAEQGAFVTNRDGASAPLDLGVKSRAIKIPSGDRLLQASLVQAEAPEAPAVCVFHGNAETLTDWAPVQALLRTAGITSLVFDYSGYGASTGRPTVRNVRQDALAAYAHFRAATPAAARHYVLGYSLGSGVLLDVLRRLRPAPDGVIIGAGFRSARAAAVVTGRVPPWVAWMLPDPWNNAARVCRLKLPLLLVHSRQDMTIPFSHAEHMARVARCPTRFITFDDLPHNAAINPDHMIAFWAPVIECLRTGELAT